VLAEQLGDERVEDAPAHPLADADEGDSGAARDPRQCVDVGVAALQRDGGVAESRRENGERLELGRRGLRGRGGQEERVGLVGQLLERVVELGGAHGAAGRVCADRGRRVRAQLRDQGLESQRTVRRTCRNL
jgi:hypothetical protein